MPDISKLETLERRLLRGDLVRENKEDNQLLHACFGIAGIQLGWSAIKSDSMDAARKLHKMLVPEWQANIVWPDMAYVRLSRFDWDLFVLPEETPLPLSLQWTTCIVQACIKEHGWSMRMGSTEKYQLSHSESATT